MTLLLSSAKSKHDPYAQQIFVQDPFVVLNNGPRAHRITEGNWIFPFEGPVILFTPFLEERFKVVLSVEENVVFQEVLEPSVVRLLQLEKCEVSVKVERLRQMPAQILLELFHNEFINPCCGALKYRDVEKEFKRYFGRSFSHYLPKLEHLCHTYEDKQGDVWVVLHSNRKKMCLAKNTDAEYFFLLRRIECCLMVGDEPLTSLFRKISAEKKYRSLLASKFTVMNKFLLKHNDDFVWFQDDRKTTKILATKQRGSLINRC